MKDASRILKEKDQKIVDLVSKLNSFNKENLRNRDNSKFGQKISEVPDIGKFEHSLLKIQKNLDLAIKQKNLWKEKFFGLKDKILEKTNHLTKEINGVRKNYERELVKFFRAYTKNLKEIVISSPYVTFQFF